MFKQNLFSKLLSFFLIILFLQSEAFAKRKKKFKGVIIVNQILKLDGTMTVNGKPAPEFSGVKEGDLLETGEKSFAVVRIVGLGIFRMGPKATFKLKSFHNRDESRFELSEGEVLSLFKRPGSHEMKMPHSLLDLHQSTFIARVGNGDGDEVQLIDGKMSVKDLLAKGEARGGSAGPAPSAPGALAVSAPPAPPTVTSPPTADSLNPKIPPRNSISKAEIKEPPKGLIEVVPHPGVEVSAVAAVDSNSVELPREATVSPDGGPKLIRLTPGGVAIVSGQSTDDGMKKNISDLESLYALP